jgi:hypothetical protein
MSEWCDLDSGLAFKLFADGSAGNADKQQVAQEEATLSHVLLLLLKHNTCIYLSVAAASASNLALAVVPATSIIVTCALSAQSDQAEHQLMPSTAQQN